MALVPVNREYWQRLYSVIESDLPEWQIVTSCSSDTMPAYFNAGFIWVHDAPRFAECWFDIAERLRRDPEIECKWPWLDQLSLPLALGKLRYRTRVLTERYNFPLHLKPMSAGADQVLCHYHDFFSFAREPRLLQDLRELMRRWPDLGEVLRKESRFAQEVAAIGTDTGATEARGRDLIITGLPRSGTSYLCRLLSEHADTVIINEPSQIFPLLAGVAEPWGLPRFYAELRRDLLAGRPVLNKHNGGRLVDDTARDGDMASPYQADVRDATFTLGTKNTLAYLSRLASIRKVMPEARFIGLIRHPYDSLASWARTFEHLRTAAVQDQPIGHPDDPNLTGWQRRALRQIEATDCLPVRRALWWRYLALQLLDAGEEVRWLRYEDLLTDPHGITNLLLTDGDLPEPSPLHWRGEMDEQERDLVAAVVCEVAERLQYIL
ncbi:hypothetical protein D3C76_640940 [compost metagenome]